MAWFLSPSLFLHFKIEVKRKKKDLQLGEVEKWPGLSRAGRTKAFRMSLALKGTGISVQGSDW